MIKQTDLAATCLWPGTSMTVNRMGYGAMQLAGPEVWGPPRDISRCRCQREDLSFPSADLVCADRPEMPNKWTGRSG
jgi:hypothetical protein